MAQSNLSTNPLWQSVKVDLFEHIDGLQSGLPKLGAPTTGTTAGSAATDIPGDKYNA